MRNHADIVKAVPDLHSFAAKLGVSIHTVRSWIQRDRIPGEMWKAFSDDGIAGLDELAHVAAERRAA